jgi:hypothetical protein
MGKERISQLFLFMAGLNAFIGAATARLDVIYFIAGLGTAALFYYLRYVLNSETDSTLRNILESAARALK